MKRRDSYLHRSGGRVFDYFGGIGTPFRVSMIRFYLYKWFGFRATKVLKGVAIKRVYIRAILAQGAHRHSWKMEEVTKRGNYETC